MVSGGVKGQHVLLWSVCVFCLLPALVNPDCLKFDFPTSVNSDNEMRIVVVQNQTATIPFTLNTQNCNVSNNQHIVVGVTKMAPNHTSKEFCKLIGQGEVYGGDNCRIRANRGNYSWSKRIDKSDGTLWTWKATYGGMNTIQDIHLVVTSNDLQVVSTPQNDEEDEEEEKEEEEEEAAVVPVIYVVISVVPSVITFVSILAFLLHKRFGGRPCCCSSTRGRNGVPEPDQQSPREEDGRIYNLPSVTRRGNGNEPAESHPYEGLQRLSTYHDYEEPQDLGYSCPSFATPNPFSTRADPTNPVHDSHSGEQSTPGNYLELIELPVPPRH